MTALDISKAYLHWGARRCGGKIYKSYSLARSFRQGGKVRKETILKLGKLSDAQVNEWRLVLKTMKGEGSSLVPVDDLVTEANYAYLDVAVLLETWQHWGLNQIFEESSQREVPLWAVVATLVINRCIDPSSKSQVSTWFQNTTLPQMLGIESSQMNTSRIFRELDVIDSLKPKISEYLYREIAKRDPSSMESVFYDLSSSTFSGTRCVLMDWGFCKEGYENHLVLALVVNKKGLPIYWEVLSGCTADVTTIELLERNLRDRFNSKTSTMVFDRGMVSDANLSLLEQRKIKYISAMDRNQLVGNSDVDFTDFLAPTADGTLMSLQASKKFCKMDATTYYHEVPLKDGCQRRYILCFNPQLCKDQRQARDEALIRFQNTVKAINKELLYAKNSRAEKSTQNKFDSEMSIEQKGFLKVRLKKKRLNFENEKGQTVVVHTYQGVVEIDQNKLQSAGLLDGFWTTVTNHTEKDVDGNFLVPAEGVVAPYKEKVIIESAFRDIKSFLEISPIHVWTMEHVKAHYTICVLGYLLDRTLTLRLHENFGECSSDIVTHARLYKELEKCLVNRTSVTGMKIERLGTTRPTEIQQDLLERIGLTHLLKKDFIKKYFPGDNVV